MTEEHTYTVTFSDLIGSKPRRVVSLVPSVTESLFVLGLGQYIVGITDYCVHPADNVKSIPKVGGTKNPDIQKIIGLRPDLVIVNNEENRIEDAKALNAAGLRIWETGPRTVAEAINILWDIVGIFDETQMVPRIQLIDRLFDMQSQAAASERRLKTFVPIWKDPWMTFNQDTYIHDLLFHIGADNIFADRERQFPLSADLGQTKPNSSTEKRDVRFPRITLEEMIKLQPELILLPTEPYAFSEDDAKILYEYDIPAAKAGNIYVIEGSLITWHGTRIAMTLNELPPLIEDARDRIEQADINGDNEE